MAETGRTELEREYVINVREQVMKVPIYRRAKKAILTIKEFLAKHMHVENRDVRKVKIDKWLNQEVWFKGIKKPLMRVKVKVKKIDGIIYAELAEIPEQIKWLVEKDKKLKQEAKQAEEASKQEPAKEEKKEETAEEKLEEKEKEKATQKAGFKAQKQEAKQEKHTSKQQNVKINRMAMQK